MSVTETHEMIASRVQSAGLPAKRIADSTPFENLPNSIEVQEQGRAVNSGPTDTSTWFASSAMKSLVACDTEAYAWADVRPRMPFSQSPLGRIIIHSTTHCSHPLNKNQGIVRKLQELKDTHVKTCVIAKGELSRLGAGPGQASFIRR